MAEDWSIKEYESNFSKVAYIPSITTRAQESGRVKGVSTIASWRIDVVKNSDYKIRLLDLSGNPIVSPPWFRTFHRSRMKQFIIAGAWHVSLARKKQLVKLFSFCSTSMKWIRVIQFASRRKSSHVHTILWNCRSTYPSAPLFRLRRRHGSDSAL